MMAIGDQNVESDGMVMSGSVCKNLEAVLTYSEVLPQTLPRETEKHDKPQSE
jgi:hypothetical protein